MGTSPLQRGFSLFKGLPDAWRISAPFIVRHVLTFWPNVKLTARRTRRIENPFG
jgi:uncharacterized membrane protein YhaH (DUF805 family)